MRFSAIRCRSKGPAPQTKTNVHVSHALHEQEDAHLGYYFVAWNVGSVILVM